MAFERDIEIVEPPGGSFEEFYEAAHSTNPESKVLVAVLVEIRDWRIELGHAAQEPEYEKTGVEFVTRVADALEERSMLVGALIDYDEEMIYVLFGAWFDAASWSDKIRRLDEARKVYDDFEAIYHLVF